MKIIFLCFLLSALTSCSSRWSLETCKETNFKDLGYQEGSDGKISKMTIYNQKCLKKGVQIPTSKYNEGYKKGLLAFCSDIKGQSDGSSGGQMHTNCRSIEAYSKAYKAGLSSFCSTEKGVNDGFSMKPEHVNCTSFDKYNKGFAKGKQEFC